MYTTSGVNSSAISAKRTRRPIARAGLPCESGMRTMLTSAYSGSADNAPEEWSPGASKAEEAEEASDEKSEEA